MMAYDVGRAVNPLLIEGQLVGGCEQGLGGALCEEFSYNQNGEPLAVTFADYLLPTLRQTPDVEVLHTEDAPSPHHPLGLKGAGEGGINGVGGIIASAINTTHSGRGDRVADVTAEGEGAAAIWSANMLLYVIVCGAFCLS
jgi:carbon-monoxide dehydrogenase large subunit